MSSGARIEFYDCEYDVELMKKTRVTEQTKTAKREKTLDEKKKVKKPRKTRTTITRRRKVK